MDNTIIEWKDLNRIGGIASLLLAGLIAFAVIAYLIWFGLGLWTTGSGFILSITLEFALLTGGLCVYLHSRKAKRIQ